VLIRAKRCRVCNHISGLLNETCGECDSADLIVVEYEPEIDAPVWTVTARRVIDTTEMAFHWESTLMATLPEFETFHDAHDFECIRVEEDGKVVTRAGHMTIFWCFQMSDAIRVGELVTRLLALRPGLMDESQVEVEFHDPVEV
jgi:hypothetical protein